MFLSILMAYTVIGTFGFVFLLALQINMSGLVWLYQTPSGLIVVGMTVVLAYLALLFWAQLQKLSFRTGEQLQRDIRIHPR